MEIPVKLRVMSQDEVTDRASYEVCFYPVLARLRRIRGNAASPISKLNRANYDQIHEKMSKDQVQAFLGSPTSTNTEDKLIYKRTAWRYTEGDKYINITFKNDELDSKDTNLGTQ